MLATTYLFLKKNFFFYLGWVELSSFGVKLWKSGLLQFEQKF